MKKQENNQRFQQHANQRVAILMDVQNLYYSAKQLYYAKVNFTNIIKTAVGKRRLIRAIAYAIKTEIKEESNFHSALEKIGIEVKTKDLQVFFGGAKKGDWDIGIAMDAVRLSNKVDTIVLVSGDGDFTELLKYLKSFGCRVEVIAFGKTCSSLLVSEADGFVNLDEDKNRFLIPIIDKGKNNSHNGPQGKCAPSKQSHNPHNEGAQKNPAEMKNMIDQNLSKNDKPKVKMPEGKQAASKTAPAITKDNKQK